jgi:hypothetical protein
MTQTFWLKVKGQECARLLRGIFLVINGAVNRIAMMFD